MSLVTGEPLVSTKNRIQIQQEGHDSQNDLCRKHEIHKNLTWHKERHPGGAPFSLCALFLLGLLDEVQEHLVHQVGVPALFQPFVSQLVEAVEQDVGFRGGEQRLKFGTHK